MDNRGSTRRGLKFEGAIKRKCGEIDSEDQMRGVGWLAGEAGFSETRSLRVVRLELRRVPICHDACKVPGSFQMRGFRCARHVMGRLRHLLHREVHGLTSRERGRVLAQLRNTPRRGNQREAAARARADRRERALQAYREASERARGGSEAVRSVNIPGRTAHAPPARRPEVPGGEDLGFHTEEFVEFYYISILLKFCELGFDCWVIFIPPRR